MERGLAQPQVTGQVGSLSALTSLQILDLCCVLVTGDISNLSALTSLRKLDLKSTQVTGDIGSLSAMTSLQQLDLKSTQVTGDIGSLSALTSLQKLDLKSTQVTGDIGSLSALTNLQTLDLLNTTVKGDIVSLNALTSLQMLPPCRTQVTGDLSSWFTARSVICITGSVSVQPLARRVTPFAIKQSSAELKARCIATSLCSGTVSRAGSLRRPHPRRSFGRAEVGLRPSTSPSPEWVSLTARSVGARIRELGEQVGLRYW